MFTALIARRAPLCLRPSAVSRLATATAAPKLKQDGNGPGQSPTSRGAESNVRQYPQSDLSDDEARKLISSFTTTHSKLPPRKERTTADARELKLRRNERARRKRHLKKHKLDGCSYDTEKEYAIREAIDTLLQYTKRTFDKTVELNFRLNIDPRKAKQTIRCAVRLPHGPLKTSHVVVFARSPLKEEALAAGADATGDAELVETIVRQGHAAKFSRVIATPDMMPVISPAARILGPKGLMPNPKHGTVTTDVAKAVREWKHNKFLMKNAPDGVVEICIGKMISLNREQLIENAAAAAMAIYEAKPQVIVKDYVDRIMIRTSFGDWLRVSKRSFNELLAEMEAAQKSFMTDTVIASST